eukprot:192306-Chlamydomonas_euryale.AAC.1
MRGSVGQAPSRPPWPAPRCSVTHQLTGRAVGREVRRIRECGRGRRFDWWSARALKSRRGHRADSPKTA